MSQTLVESEKARCDDPRNAAGHRLVATVPALVEGLALQARDYAEAGMAANTRLAYASDWRDFEAFCSEVGAAPLPAWGQLVALYLTRRASTLSVATLGRRVAAIRTAHKVANEPSPPAASCARCGPASAVPMAAHRLRSAPWWPMTCAAPWRPCRTACRASGTAPWSWWALGRRFAVPSWSASSWTAPGPGDPASASWPGGLEVHLDRSKADPEGHGAVIAIPHGQRLDTCAVRALEAWVKAAGITSGPIFRPVNRWGQVAAKAMTDHGAALVVKAAAERIGLDPDAFAGHSLHAGLATSAAANDAPAEVIMRHMRHARFDTTRRYIRQGEQFKRNAAG